MRILTKSFLGWPPVRGRYWEDVGTESVGGPGRGGTSI